MRCSVIVPMYNASATILACMESIQSQNVMCEIIVVDDASLDDSTSIIPVSDTVRLIEHMHNQGPSAARNTGADKAISDILVFIDSDTILHPKALEQLLSPLESDATLLGTNGIFALNTPAEGNTSAFVNTSIHFQHLGHGKRVNTSFTAICALRKSAFVEMGGWDTRRRSRYADDVNTRWHLPRACIELVKEAQADHLKMVSFTGLMKHRFNIGYHFIHSLIENADSVASKPKDALLHPRYPINTILGMGFLIGIPFPPLWFPLLGLGFINNASFMIFTYNNRSTKEALLATPLSLLEGMAYALGILQGGRHKFR